MKIGATLEAGKKIPSLDVDFYVISYNNHLIQNTVRALRDYGIPYFLFPNIYLSETRPEVSKDYNTLLKLVKEDLGYFVRKDRNPDNSPLAGMWYDVYNKNIEKLKNPVTISERFKEYALAKHIVEGEADYTFLSQIVGDKHYPITKSSFEYGLLLKLMPENVVLLSSTSIKSNLRLLRFLK